MTLLHKIKKGVFGIVMIFIMFELALLGYVFSFYDRQDTARYDCAVVFGASVLPGGRPSAAISDRVLSAVELYKNNKVHCLVLSGAPSVFGAHEVDVMKEIVLKNSINSHDLVFDRKGFNTRQTVLNLDKEKSYIFVSNDFHLARINLFARQTNIKEWGLFASDYKQGRYATEWRSVIRESFALVFYYFF